MINCILYLKGPKYEYNNYKRNEKFSHGNQNGIKANTIAIYIYIYTLNFYNISTVNVVQQMI